VPSSQGTHVLSPAVVVQWSTSRSPGETRIGGRRKSVNSVCGNMFRVGWKQTGGNESRRNSDQVNLFKTKVLIEKTKRRGPGNPRETHLQKDLMHVSSHVCATEPLADLKCYTSLNHTDELGNQVRTMSLRLAKKKKQEMAPKTVSVQHQNLTLHVPQS